MRYAFTADIVFKYFKPGSINCFRHYKTNNGTHTPLFFTLCLSDSQAQKKIHGDRDSCSLESGVIYQGLSINSCLYKIIMEINKQQKKVGVCSCRQLHLTLREQEIMKHLKQEMSTSKIADTLKISQKTVSNHKVRVMRKMGFRRNHELYQWLREETVTVQNPLIN
ncbi:MULTISPECIES: response regulator transcription factor [Serratia]